LLIPVEAGLDQILAYMLATPHLQKPVFGMITSGGSFIFINFIRLREGLRFYISGHQVKLKTVAR
jgi:hypothetical protein